MELAKTLYSMYSVQVRNYSSILYYIYSVQVRNQLGYCTPCTQYNLGTSQDTVLHALSTGQELASILYSMYSVQVRNQLGYCTPCTQYRLETSQYTVLHVLSTGEKLVMILCSMYSTIQEPVRILYSMYSAQVRNQLGYCTPCTQYNLGTSQDTVLHVFSTGQELTSILYSMYSVQVRNQLGYCTPCQQRLGNSKDTVLYALRETKKVP